jgi:hypothetical protein
LACGHSGTPTDRELGAAIWKRCSNREPYSDEIVPSVIRAELDAAARSENGLLHFLDENEAARISHLVAAAERQLLSNPAYRAELGRWAGGDPHRRRHPKPSPRTEIGPWPRPGA